MMPPGFRKGVGDFVQNMQEMGNFDPEYHGDA
jgi:hypothetical protein